MPKLTAYKSLEVYAYSKRLVAACYGLTHELPDAEKTNFSRYLRTAGLNFHMSVAQAAFAKKKKKKKYLKEARNALVIIDAATDILVEVGLASPDSADEILRISAACFPLLDQI